MTTQVVSTAPAIVDTSMVLVYAGDCELVMSDAAVMEDFKNQVVSSLTAATGLDSSRFTINDVNCGSVEVSLTVSDTAGTDIPDTISDLASTGQLSVSVNSRGTVHNFTSEEATVIDDEPEVEESTDSFSWDDLSYVEQIIIIVTCIVVGLVVFCSVCCLVCKCHRKKYSKSFTLQETPPEDVKTEDFTLTKMDRPQPVYTDDGIVLPLVDSNGHTNGVVKVGYENEMYQEPSKTNVYTPNPVFNQIEEEEPLYDTADIIRSPSTERLMSASHRTGDGGHDNPSFSSDDILDSGTEADVTEDLHGDMSSPDELARDQSPYDPHLPEEVPLVAVPAPFSAASSDSGMAAHESSNTASPDTSDTRAVVLDVDLRASRMSDTSNSNSDHLNDSLNSSQVPEIEEEPAVVEEPKPTQVEESEPVSAIETYVLVPDVIPAPPPPDVEEVEDIPEGFPSPPPTEQEAAYPPVGRPDSEYAFIADLPPPLPEPIEDHSSENPVDGSNMDDVPEAPPGTEHLAGSQLIEPVESQKDIHNESPPIEALDMNSQVEKGTSKTNSDTQASVIENNDHTTSDSDKPKFEEDLTEL